MTTTFVDVIHTETGVHGEVPEASLAVWLARGYEVAPDDGEGGSVLPFPYVRRIGELSGSVELAELAGLLETAGGGYATAADITAAVNSMKAQILDAPPAALDTLNELSAALGDDPNLRDNLLAALALKADLSAIETMYAAHTPGKELGYAEVLSSLTSTATDVGAAAALAGLSVTVIGQGKPVEIEYFCPSVNHTVANTSVSIALGSNGSKLSAQSQIGATSAASTVAGLGKSISVKRRAVLTLGVSYTFTVHAFAYGVAGTSILYAANPYEPQFLSVVAR